MKKANLGIMKKDPNIFTREFSLNGKLYQTFTVKVSFTGIKLALNYSKKIIELETCVN